MTLKGVGRGKLILFGEHSAVYGHSAVGTSLDCRTELNWAPKGRDSTGHSAGPETPDETGRDREVFLDLLAELSTAGFRHECLSSGVWRRTGDVPRAGGFGSSAALCVALSRIISGNPDESYNREVHLLANNLESRFHGTPSGIDSGMSSDNGPSIWTGSADNLPLRIPIKIPEWRIIYGALPRQGSTGESVGGLGRRVVSGDTAAVALLNHLGEIAAGFIDSVKDRKPGEYTDKFSVSAAESVNLAQETLASLDLSSPELDILLNLAGKTGADGGKLSGGGLGGAFFLCVSNRKRMNRVMDNLPDLLEEKGIELTVPLTPFVFKA